VPVAITVTGEPGFFAVLIRLVVLLPILEETMRAWI